MKCLDDHIAEDNTIRAVDALVEKLRLLELGFEGTEPAATGRPSNHPAALLKIYVRSQLNSIQSSRRLAREAQPTNRALGARLLLKRGGPKK